MSKISNYFKFLWGQMHGWSMVSYFLLFAATGFQIGLFVTDISGWNAVSMISSILGVACVLSISNAKSINGFFGLISAVMICAVSFHATNYLTIAMQLSYIVFLDIPVLIDPSWNKNVESHIKRFNGFHNYALAILLNIAVFAVSFYLITHLTNDHRALIDAISFSVGFTGSLLCWKRYSEQYYWWFAGGIISIVLWGATALQGDANFALFATYIIYLMNDGIGFFISPWFKKKPESKKLLA